MDLRRILGREERGSTASRIGGRQSSQKHELLRSRVESQLRAQLLDRKRRHARSGDSVSSSRCESPSEPSLSQSSVASRAHSYSYIETSRNGKSLNAPGRHDRLRQLEAAYAPGARRRSASAESKTPPPVLRRRLDRPGRPLVPAARSKDGSLSPSNVRMITRRLLPSRPGTASRRDPLSNLSNFSLNTTVNGKSSSSLRSRLENLSKTLFVEDKSANDYAVSGYGRANRPNEARFGEPLISGGGAMSANLEVEEAPPPGKSVRELCFSPSPREMQGRKEQARAELEQKQEEFALDSPRGMVEEGPVLVLQSLEIARSSVSSLSELIRAKEREIEARKAEYSDKRKSLLEKRREALEQEMKIKQLEYLRQLEEEELDLVKKAESAQKLSESLTEKIINQSREIERLQSVDSSWASCSTPERTTRMLPEMFSIASPQLGEVSPVSVSSPPEHPDEPVDSPKHEDMKAKDEDEDDEDDQLTDYVIMYLIEQCLVESERPVDPTPKKKIRIDAFDIALASQPILSSELAPVSSAESIIAIISLAARDFLQVSGSSELLDSQVNALRKMDFASIIFSSLPQLSHSMVYLVADAFLDLLGSLPPAAAADRAWLAQNYGARKSPLSSFLPQNHTLDHLLSQLKALLEYHARRPDLGRNADRIDRVCNEIFAQFGLDQVASFSHENNKQVEEEILLEVNEFIIEALVTSVASDFESLN